MYYMYYICTVCMYVCNVLYIFTYIVHSFKQVVETLTLQEKKHYHSKVNNVVNFGRHFK